MEPILRINNNWHIVQIKTDKKETDLLELKERQLKYIIISIARAIATSDKKCDEGY